MARKQAAKPAPLVRPSEPYLYVDCRATGHEWRRKGGLFEDTIHGARPIGVRWDAIGIRSQCNVCKTWRTRWYLPSGQIAHAPSYEHPDGYKTSGEEVRTLEQWRKDFVTHLMEELPRAADVVKSA